MNIDNLRDFVKDLFTLRTVWIDKGSGRWAVKKRLHPLMKGILCTLGVILCAVVYAGLNRPEAVKAEPQPIMLAKLPSPEQLHVDVKPSEPTLVLESQPDLQNVTEPAAIPPFKPVENIIIPLTTKKTKAATVVEHDTSIWPTQKPKLEPAPETPPKPAVNNGKYNIRISKLNYTLTLYKGTEPVKTYPIAVGKNPGDKQRTGDNRTPVGDFKIVSIENASKWTHDFRDGKGKIKGAYGPWFLRLDAKGWKGIGIHGTHAPDSIGTMATEGCIRLFNEDIAELKQYAYRNMPVVIREN